LSPLLIDWRRSGIRFVTAWQRARRAAVVVGFELGTTTDGQSAESSTKFPFERMTPPSLVSRNCFQSLGFVTIEC
jgi:hypothetical protein